jgi:hypothetical protein
MNVLLLFYCFLLLVYCFLLLVFLLLFSNRRMSAKICGRCFSS